MRYLTGLTQLEQIQKSPLVWTNKKLNIFNPPRWVLFVEMRFLTALIANDDGDDE